jgi:hypothetical protein
MANIMSMEHAKRTQRGRQIAKSQGVKFVRKPTLSTDDISEIRRLHASGHYTLDAIAVLWRVNRSTISRAIAKVVDCKSDLPQQSIPTAVPILKKLMKSSPISYSEISRNVPLSEHKGTWPKAHPAHNLEPGESYFVDQNRLCMTSYLSRIGKLTQKKFVAEHRTENNIKGTRVWRVY